jgi:hypothetical protein
MKILAIEKEVPGIKEEDYIPYLKEEAGKAWQLYEAGIFREMYFTGKDEAVIIMECENTEAATDILQTLPLVKAGLIKFETSQLLPYPGFKRLFTE